MMTDIRCDLLVYRENDDVQIKQSKFMEGSSEWSRGLASVVETVLGDLKYGYDHQGGTGLWVVRNVLSDDELVRMANILSGAVTDDVEVRHHLGQGEPEVPESETADDVVDMIGALESALSDAKGTYTVAHLKYKTAKGECASARTKAVAAAHKVQGLEDALAKLR